MSQRRTPFLETAKRYARRSRAAQKVKFSLKKCCTKMKDAYKYGQEHGRVFVNQVFMLVYRRVTEVSHRTHGHAR